MNKKPIIGIIGRPDIASDDDKVICAYESTRRAIVKKGGIPILILPNQDLEYVNEKPNEINRLNNEQKEDLIRVLSLCDAILIPGGYKWFEYDEFIYNYALDKDIPILGICLGMQIMAKIDNYKINKDTKNILNETSINHRQREEKYVHEVDLVDNTILKSIINKDTINVNSKHNYHIESTNELVISAYSKDGLIEGVEHKNKRFVVGVQWHPESMLEYDIDANKIFDRFINEASKTNY